MHSRCKQALRSVLLATVVILLTACGPQDAPKDQAGPCYTAYRDGLRGRRPSLTIRYTLTERQWPELERVLKAFASKAHLQVFDTSTANPELRVFEISMCNSDGIAILTRQQVLNQQNGTNRPLNMTTYLYQYRQFFGWRQVGEALAEEFQRQAWQVNVEWFQPR